jgi:hypothetical protein
MTTTTLTNVERLTPNKLNSKFRRGPSKTRLEDLKIGKREYQARTVEDMKAVMETKIEETIKAIDTFDAWGVTIAKSPLVAPMATRTLNGFKVKIGYGAKNEKFPEFDTEYFARRAEVDEVQEAIDYLEDIKSALKSGELDSVLHNKLVNFRRRSTKGGEAMAEKAGTALKIR